jgi:transposase-like protein
MRSEEGRTMWCPHCASADTSERRERTALGYRRFRCHTCKREFNERTGTSFTHLQYPTDVVCLVVLWRVRYQLSLRDLPEMFLERGLVFTHEAVREWEAQRAPLLSATWRKHRRGRIGPSWYVEEPFITVKGRVVSLYRAIDRDGNPVDVLLSETRDKAAAPAFFRSARTVTGHSPARVTSDGHDAYPGALTAELGGEVRHRTNRYLNNHLEQDHRGIKQRIRPMGGFKSVESANRFCRVHDAVRNFLRPRSYRHEVMSLAQRRLLYTARTRVLLTSLAAA